MTEKTITVTIRNRWTNEPIYSTDIPGDTPSGMQTRVALEKAASDRAYLGGADLRDADLRGAYLGGADLRDADLRGAYLGGADLRDADLRGAYLGGADLRDADLRDAYLGDAYLGDADLRDADLRDAYLGDAYLGDADLRDAYLGDAYLGGADLRGAYLGGANLGDVASLWNTTGDRRHIKSLQIETWSVTYTATHMQIGCQLHTLERWWGFSDERISRMDEKALAWWGRWKPVLQQIIAMSPAEPGGEKPAEEPVPAEPAAPVEAAE